MRIPIFDDGNYGLTKSFIVAHLRRNRDPLPERPKENPRISLPIEKQKFFVAPGEFVRVRTLDSVRTAGDYASKTADFIYPSGFSETVGYLDIESYLHKLLGVEFGSIAYSVVLNNRHCILYPHEKIYRSVLEFESINERGLIEVEEVYF